MPTRSTSPAWMRWVLIIAGVYNLLWGAAVVLFPLALFDLTGLDRPTYPSIWQCVGMIVGVYGVGYLAAARDPARHWPIVLVGLLGKIFGPIGFVIAASRGELPWTFGFTILTNDLIWWVPFGAMLWHAAERHGAIDDADGPGTVRDELARTTDQQGRTALSLTEGAGALVVFIRHAGCTFCKETLADLARQRADVERAGLTVVVVHMSTDERAAALLGRYGLDDVARVSDPDRRLYRAFELTRGRFGQLFGPAVWARGVAATLRGHLVGGLDGDGFQMPGAFVVRDGRIERAFRHRHAGERADYAELACELPAGAPA